ncbi:major_cap_HK97, phage major capsid protein, HK97 family [uncultured Caudovirales phage]|uniref:Major_cap_HK97, phage major capsid protein, HK97 family n=1 Tax=uncultured Caudovirales phage TaxID=2100421 RepID=A0A6J5MM70_9CAUD|nr:major_cap_HK97, phage major capsid protein, HK97 family [uncultured Caudovirales phage]
MSEKLIEKRSALIAEAQKIVEAAEAEARDLTAEEDSEIAVSLRSASELDESIKHHKELEVRAAEAAELRKVIGGAVVKNEARTYSLQADTSFIRDAYAAQFNNDYMASERLARHMSEERIERRDVTSTNFAGLVVPQFLTDLAAPFARAGRVTADLARKHQLPNEGLTISISKVTTGTAVASQSEGATVQETNMDDTKLDLTVKTFAGQQNVSRQALERGTNIDSLVMADLVSAYHTTLNTAVVAELLASAGQAVTYTDASPTVAELYPKLVDAIQKVQTTFFAGPNVIIMHPRRLGMILAAVDGQNRPLAVPTPSSSGQPAYAYGSGAPQYGNSGYSILGLPVYTDATISIVEGAGTNQDTIYIGNSQELHLWEQGSGEPMMLRFEQPKAAELDVTMIVYGYSAFTANRYANAWAQINGTGLVTPTF